jgi:hypothetical protein
MRMGRDVDYYGNGLALDPSGNPHVTGSFQGTADFGSILLTATGNLDIFVAKLDGGGTVQWARQMGGASYDYGVAIEVDARGNAYVSGTVEGTVTMGSDYIPADLPLPHPFVARLDASGRIHWANLGRRGWGLDVATDGTGNAYMAGDFQQVTSFGATTLTSVGLEDVFVAKLGGCGPPFATDPSYGQLVFGSSCTQDASGLTQDLYSGVFLPVLRSTNDRFYLSSKGTDFLPLAVDDVMRINGVDSGLGPYTPQPGVPPFLYGAPIDYNLVPEAPQEVTSLIPTNPASIPFRALDTDREIYGKTAVYLVRDCGIVVRGKDPMTTRFLAHDDAVAGLEPEFDVRYGSLSELRADRDFSRASCLDRFLVNPVSDSLPDPAPGDGRYYLARGLSSCIVQGHGDSRGPVPDPRDALDALPACP